MDLTELRESIERECQGLAHMSKVCIEVAELAGKFDRRELDGFFEGETPFVALLARMERQLRDGAENMRTFRTSLVKAKGASRT